MRPLSVLAATLVHSAAMVVYRSEGARGPMAACNDLTKREAQVLIKRKFPPRPSGCGETHVAGAQRSRGHLRRGCAAASPAGLIGPRRIYLQGGGETAVRNSGELPSLLPGAGACAGTFWSGSRPRRRSRGGRRRAKEGGASWRTRASPSGGVRELSGGGRGRGRSPLPTDGPPRGRAAD